jgi:DNA-binding NtrC family response regulator
MHVLVIDDEPAVRQIVVAAVTRGGYSVDQASGVIEAAAKLSRGDVDVALCDIKMPDGNGVDLVRSTKAAGIETQFIMVTAFASVENAVEALRAGASDYVVKPVRSEELLHRLSQIEALCGLREQNRVLRKFVDESAAHVYRSESPTMLQVDRLVAKVAPTDSTVLVTGESGTGKSVVARAIHQGSKRGDAVFLPVNCSAIPEHLLEAEFFGHTKGAFTGADRARKGLFLQADKGTLFLDEIGELPLHVQTKLLHAIEDKEIRPIGAEQGRKVDTRIVAATNRNLDEMVRQGKFREDLYFRLSMFHIHLPPLRERPVDIRGLIQFFLAMQAARDGAGRTLELDPDAEDMLMAYHWPGNVRQLENVINRAHILSDGSRISVADLPVDVTRSAPSAAAGDALLPTEGLLRDQLRQFEAKIIARTLDEQHGDRRAAAQRLGIGLSSLYRKIEEFEAAGLLRAGLRSATEFSQG